MENGSEYSQVRQWARVQLELRVKISYSRHNVLQSTHGRSHDIGEGGFSIYVPCELIEGEHVELEFTLPASRTPIRARATVRNREGFRYGIEFVTLTKAQRDDIARLSKAYPALTRNTGAAS
ncbi:MAG TPA: PilZ domain-containing protein [Clostridia bacterium]|nr:PilZ domain-containing protein [Clostridia bacterium]